MNPILTTGDTRNAELLDVPIAREAGLPKLTLEFWAGMTAPAGTPMDIVTKLNGAIHDALQSPEMKQRMSALGLDAKIGTPQQFTSFMAKEVPLWSEIIQKTSVNF